MHFSQNSLESAFAKWSLFITLQYKIASRLNSRKNWECGASRYFIERWYNSRCCLLNTQEVWQCLPTSCYTRQPNMMLFMLQGRLSCRVTDVVQEVSPLFFPTDQPHGLQRSHVGNIVSRSGLHVVREIRKGVQ
jgi:ferredoxin-like protein FixX